jgi:GNAT superfamily N-acetyltransferase
VPGPGIQLVGEEDLADLLPLLRGYCGFYERTIGVPPPPDAALLAQARALIADPEHEGLQLLARDADGTAVGFATLLWTWSTLSAARIAVMNDLFVAEGARGAGVAEQLIRACATAARERGCVRLTWQTALDNVRAQSVYDRVGAVRSRWLDYALEV